MELRRKRTGTNEHIKIKKRKTECNVGKEHSLLSAVHDGRLHTVRKLVNNLGLSYGKEWPDGYELLRLALGRKHREVAKLLLSYDSKVNNNGEFTITPLHYAATFGDVEMVELLLDRNAQIDAKDKYHRTPLHYAVGNNNIGTVKLLLNHRTCVNTSDENGETPLHVACMTNNSEIADKLEVTELLINCGADVNCKDGRGKTPIFYATQDLHLKIIKLLLANGANIDDNNIEDNNYLLSVAVDRASIEIINILLQCKYTPNVQGEIADRFLNVGVSADYCQKNNTVTITNIPVYGENITPLHIAASTGHALIVEMLLNKGAMVNVKRIDGTTALHTATKMGHAKVVKVLIKYDADVNSRTDDDITPLHLAAENGDLDILEILIKFGADVNLLDVHSNAALHIACQFKHRYIVTALLQNGSDINIRNMYGRTALDIAWCKMDPCCVSCFIAFHVGNLTCLNFVIRHIVKLKADNLFVNEKDLKKFKRKPLLYNYYHGCEIEISEMKNSKIYDTYVSFYDILKKDVHQLAIYAENEDIVEAFNSTEFTKRFPIYADLMQYQFKKGQERQCLIQSGTKSFNFLFGYELPQLFANKLYRLLSNVDLTNLINACSYDNDDVI